MAELNQQQVVDYIKGISVLELSQLVKTNREVAELLAGGAPGAGSTQRPPRAYAATSCASAASVTSNSAMCAQPCMTGAGHRRIWIFERQHDAGHACDDDRSARDGPGKRAASSR